MTSLLRVLEVRAFFLNNPKDKDSALLEESFQFRFILLSAEMRLLLLLCFYSLVCSFDDLFVHLIINDFIIWTFIYPIYGVFINAIYMYVLLL